MLKVSLTTLSVVIGGEPKKQFRSTCCNYVVSEFHCGIENKCLSLKHDQIRCRTTVNTRNLLEERAKGGRY